MQQLLNKIEEQINLSILDMKEAKETIKYIKEKVKLLEIDKENLEIILNSKK